MNPLKIYVAGKVSADSHFKTSFWREGFCKELEKASGCSLINLDPAKGNVDQNDSLLVFGRCCL